MTTHHRSPILPRSLLLPIIAVLGAALLLAPAVARAEKFVIAWSAVSALNSPFWVMHDAGFLKQEGLDMELVYIASSPTVARATLAGDIVISGANSPPVSRVRRRVRITSRVPDRLRIRLKVRQAL